MVAQNEQLQASNFFRAHGIVHADGDDEDIGEGEFERDRQAYLKYRQSARP